MALKDHKCKLTTVKKWEKELNYKLEYDVSGIDVVCLRCAVYKRWECVLIKDLTLTEYVQEPSQLRKID